MRDFLEWLWGDQPRLGELRVINGAVVTQLFYNTPEHLDGLMSDALYYDGRGFDVYMGVLPRIREGGKANDVTEYTNTLWADVDAKSHGDDKRAALDAILDFPVPPSVILDSGHGYHAHWRLTDHIIFEDAHLIMKGIAKRIGGDAVYDRARILRIPGTHNHKDIVNVPVRLIRFDTTLSYPVSDLAEYEYEEPATYRVSVDGITRNVLTANFRPDKFNIITERFGDSHHPDLDFDPGKGARSEHDYGVVCWMVEHGWYDAEILEVFLTHPEGVGAKTAKSGIGYIQRTIDKARRNTL